MSSRRTFLFRALAASARPRALALAAAPAGIRYGYAAITRGKEERQAIDDISSAGYAGIQLHAEALTDFQPTALRGLPAT